MDIFGEILRIMPSCRCKLELQRIWARTIRDSDRVCVLACGATINTDMRVRYERQIWLKDEEWDELEFLRTQITSGDCFIDVGANIGLWTLTAASCVGQAGRVYSFEPNPDTFAKLRSNVCRNMMEETVMLMNQAVSSTQGDIRFKCENAHNISHIATERDTEAIMVKSASLDSILPSVPSGKRIVGVKMDTEGHELDVLLGAQELIERDSPWLIVEFNTHILPSRMLCDWDVFKHLSQLGYYPYRYDKSHASPIEPGFIENSYCNILFKRASGGD